jgi:hypothetical protein
MLAIDQDSLAAIQPELTPGETVLWAARPRAGVVFHGNEYEPQVLISLLIGGFTILWEALVIWSLWSTPSHRVRSVLLICWGVPFVIDGQYRMWGRFFYAAWKKKKTYYAVTNRRVIVVHNFRGHQVASAEISALQILLREKYSDEVGTMRFVAPPALFARTWSEMITLDKWEAWDPLSIKRGPVFEDVEDVDSVFQLISALRAKTNEAEVIRLLHDRSAS